MTCRGGGIGAPDRRDPRRIVAALTSALNGAPTVTLLGIGDREALLAHPVAGESWEDLGVESLIVATPHGTEPYFFHTAAGAEIDLLLTLPGQRAPWGMERLRLWRSLTTWKSMFAASVP